MQAHTHQVSEGSLLLLAGPHVQAVLSPSIPFPLDLLSSGAELVSQSSANVGRRYGSECGPGNRLPGFKSYPHPVLALGLESCQFILSASVPLSLNKMMSCGHLERTRAGRLFL